MNMLLKKSTKEELQKEIKTLTYRHIAWMTALRHAMREAKNLGNCYET